MKKITQPQIWLPLLMIFWALNVVAQEPPAYDEETAKLLEQVELKTIDGRQMADVPLKLVLQLALDRSISLQVLTLGSESVERAVTAAEERNTPLWSNSFVSAKSPSMSSATTGSSIQSQTFSSAFSKKTDSGITYGLTYSENNKTITSLTRTDFGEELTVGDAGSNFSTASLTSSVSIPLFQDFGSSFNRIPVKLAEVGVVRDKVNVEESQANLLKQVASIYWDLVGVLETIEAKKKALELSEKLLRDNQARHEAGLLSATEVQVTETQLMRDRQSLLSSRQDALQIEDQVRAALNLGKLPVGLYPIDKPATQSFAAKDIQELMNRVYEKDAQIGLTKASLEQNSIELEQAQNQQDSNMDLSLSYVMNGYSENQFGGTADFSNSDLQGMSATFTWNIPLGDQATTENIQRKRLARQQLLLQIEDRKSQLDVSVQSYLRTLKLREQERQTAAAVEQLSKTQLRNEIERFKLGKSTSYRVSQYQEDVVQAQQQEIMIRINWEKVYLELLALTGEIFDRYELTLN